MRFVLRAAIFGETFAVAGVPAGGGGGVGGVGGHGGRVAEGDGVRPFDTARAALLRTGIRHGRAHARVRLKTNGETPQERGRGGPIGRSGHGAGGA